MSRRAELLAEARLWLSVAVRIDEGPAISGLCAALDLMYWRTTPRPLYEAAKARLNRARANHRRAWAGTFVYPPCVRGPRVLAALWLALECEDEALALSPRSRPSRGRKGNA